MSISNVKTKQNYTYYSLHYHMKSGGVKIVIENLMKAFDLYSKNKFSLIEAGEQFDYSPKSKINHIKIPEIDYIDKKFSSYEKLLIYSKKIAKKIEKYLNLKNKCVLHVHNPNLFKNSFLSKSLEILANDNDNLLLIVQVHDFAEDNRQAQLKLMQTCTGKIDKNLAANLAYPLADNIIYFTINSRDKRLLKKIGIPHERIFLFPNAVNTEFFNVKTKSNGLKRLLSTYAQKNGYNFSEKRKILLYPVKIIQRKNVIEAILLLNILNSIKDEYQLLITLDASSKYDIKYSDVIKDYVKKNNLPVTIGFGFKIISSNEIRSYDSTGKITEYLLPDLMSISEAIISTSMLEGFGFAFIEGWIANKKIIGRRIDFIIEDFEKKGIKFPGMYDKIMIGNTDFKDLSHKQQLRILSNKNFKEIISQSGIQVFLKELRNKDFNIIKQNKKIILKEFTLKRYIKLLDNYINIGFKYCLEKNNTTQLKKNNLNNIPLINYFNATKEKTIIISDMDGTFLDHNNYSYVNSHSAFKKANLKDIPVCFCTSKSFPEVMYFCKKLKTFNPFIAENGSAIYVPNNYFSFDINKIKWRQDYDIKRIKNIEGYIVIELNVTHNETYNTLKKIQRKLSFPTFIYSDHSIDEFKKYLGLPKKMAELTKIKFYADGFRVPNLDEKMFKEIAFFAKKEGFTTVAGGRIVGINKGCDKGKATSILIELFEKEYKRIRTIGIGDSNNDYPMLMKVDYPFLVSKNKKSNIDKNINDIEKVNGIGPKGFAEVVNKFL
ncbi:MAG: HAD-IIB family hydrolase [Candidatus Woesearchaeota archaeon]